MKRFMKWVRSFKKRYGWGAIAFPLCALIAGGGLVCWGLSVSGFDIIAWLGSPQALTIYIIAALVVVALLVLWGMS